MKASILKFITRLKIIIVHCIVVNKQQLTKWITNGKQMACERLRFTDYATIIYSLITAVIQFYS